MKKFLVISMLLLSILALGVSATVDFSPTSLNLGSVNPGQSASSTTTTLTNNEDVQYIFTFSNYALTSGSRSFNLNTISDVTLGSGANSALTIQTTVPSNQYAGTYSGSLTATATNQTSITRSLPVTLVVNSVPAVTATSASFSAGRGITRTNSNAFTVTNTGNTDLSSVSISVNDLSDGINTLPLTYLSFSPSSTSVNYGSSANVAITTNIPASQQTGIYTGTITITYGGQTTTSSLTITVRDPVHDVKVANNEVKLGDSSQTRNQTITKSFTVDNQGDYAEQVTLVLANVPTKYSATLSTLGFTLQPGQTQTVIATATVPDSQDSGAKTIGTIQLTYNQQTTNLPLKLETKSMLSITKIETRVDGSSSDSSLKDGETLSDEAKPGDEIEFEITVKNIYPSSADVKIEDIEIKLEPRDDDIDEDETTDTFDLNENNDKKKTLKIKVPEKIYEGDYDVDITVEGEDENGATHTVFWTVTFEVEKDTNDVRITDATIGTSTLKCVRTTELRVTIANFGSKDQEKAALVILAPDFGINENIMNLDLDYDHEDRDNDFTKIVSINAADDFAPGNYQITIKAFRNNDVEMEQEIVNLKVEDCPAPVEPEENTTVVITPTTTGQTGSQGGTSASTTNVVDTVETSFTNSTAFILLLVAINMIVLLVIVVLVFKFLL